MKRVSGFYVFVHLICVCNWTAKMICTNFPNSIVVFNRQCNFRLRDWWHTFSFTNKSIPTVRGRFRNAMCRCAVCRSSKNPTVLTVSCVHLLTHQATHNRASSICFNQSCVIFGTNQLITSTIDMANRLNSCKSTRNQHAITIIADAQRDVCASLRRCPSAACHLSVAHCGASIWPPSVSSCTRARIHAQQKKRRRHVSRNKLTFNYAPDCMSRIIADILRTYSAQAQADACSKRTQRCLRWQMYIFTHDACGDSVSSAAKPNMCSNSANATATSCW